MKFDLFYSIIITVSLSDKMGCLINLILIIIAVAFFTFIERKILGYIHIRKGPNKPRPLGITVPFADAVKLFNKEINLPFLSNYYLFLCIALIIIVIPIILWAIPTLPSSHSYHPLSIIIAIAIISPRVYGTLGAGWRRNRKYSLLGAVRATAQTISYEVRISVIILCSVVYIIYDLRQSKQIPVFTWFSIVFLIFSVSVLAEANRSPFDFAEGERELVRGFNTEYRSVLFVIVFLAEYMSIIFISMLAAVLFLSSSFTETILFTLVINCFYVWSRGTLPRFRYDQLIRLAWKCFLPISLSVLMYRIMGFSLCELWKFDPVWAKIIYIIGYGVASIIIALIFLILSFITYKNIMDKEKSSPFECGFDPTGITRIPFCIKFFIVTVIFLIFDVEVALLLPILFSSYMIISFLIILLLGVLYEWGFGGLTWLI